MIERVRSVHALLSFTAVALSACGFAPRTEIPIPTITSDDQRKSGTLLVMLPGRGDRATSLVDAGFLKQAGESTFDAVAVDAHFGYYTKRSLIPRLHEDVIKPAQDVGYENIWLLGVSMGGLGAILYAAEYPDVVDGLILLAPYLGDPALAAEVRNSGGLASWDADQSQFKDHEVAAWRWLQSSRSEAAPVPILMGYGTEDRFAEYYGPLKGEIAGLTVYTEAGGHKWTTWRELWKTMQLGIDPRQ